MRPRRRAMKFARFLIYCFKYYRDYAMILVIVESPAKAKKIQGILGSDYTVAASVGHIQDLPTNSIGIGPEYQLEYQLTERGATVVDRLKTLVTLASDVYLATDPDREGESISWHLKTCLGLPDNAKRITFNEITEKAIRHAISHPRILDMDLVDAQNARRACDRDIGYLVSPALNRATGQSLSAGRVQSPALEILVDREDAIAAFTPTQHFGVQATFLDGQPWTATWALKPTFVNDATPYFQDKPFAERVAAQTSFTVLKFSEFNKKRSPPAPFVTSTLQQAASVALKMSPGRTMEIAQKLHLLGAITYHRTDNPNISEESLPDIARVASAMDLQMAPSLRRFPIPDSAQEGHAAITPTHWDHETVNADPESVALYQLIRTRAIACQLADAVYATRTARLSAGAIDDRAIEFEATGKTQTSAGWMALLAGDQTNESEIIESSNPIPFLKAGQTLTAKSAAVTNKKTVAPKRYTEASLIKELDALGIGRPSTFASILENIKSKNYVAFDGLVMNPTPTARTVVTALRNAFSFMDLGYTRNLESDLDKIARGHDTYHSVISKLDSSLRSEITAFGAASAPRAPRPSATRTNGHANNKSAFARKAPAKTPAADAPSAPRPRTAFGARSTQPAATTPATAAVASPVPRAAFGARSVPAPTTSVPDTVEPAAPKLRRLFGRPSEGDENDAGMEPA